MPGQIPGEIKHIEIIEADAVLIEHHLQSGDVGAPWPGQVR